MVLGSTRKALMQDENKGYTLGRIKTDLKLIIKINITGLLEFMSEISSQLQGKKLYNPTTHYKSLKFKNQGLFTCISKSFFTCMSKSLQIQVEVPKHGFNWVWVQ